MKVTISNEPTELELDEVQFEQLKAAMQGRQPAHTITFDDGSGVVINTETGVTIKYGPAKSAKASTEKMVPDPDPNADPDRTVQQLKEALDKAGIDHSAAKVKADYQKLVRDNNL